MNRVFGVDSAGVRCTDPAAVLSVSRSQVPVSPRSGRPLLTHLQCLRGLAALTVVLSHLPHWLPAFAAHDQVYDAGVVAVFVFFAISGYIIAYSHRGETGWTAAGIYASKRAFRLLPAYLVFSAAAFALHALHWFTWDHYVTAPQGTLGRVTALTLLPLQGGRSVSFLAVGWSLFYEVTFYLLFAAFFFGRRTGIAVLALATAAVVVNEVSLALPGVWMSWISLLLFAGCAFGLYRGRVPLPPRMFYFLGGCGAAFLVTAILHPLRAISQPCGMIGAALVTLCAIGLDQAAGARPSGWIHRALNQLGNVSYSLYLCHTVVQAVLYHFVGPPRLAWGVGVTYVLAPLAVAWASYRWIERPAQNFARVLVGLRATALAPVVPGEVAPVEAFPR